MSENNRYIMILWYISENNRCIMIIWYISEDSRYIYTIKMHLWRCNFVYNYRVAKMHRMP